MRSFHGYESWQAVRAAAAFSCACLRRKKKEEKCKWLRVKHAGKFAQATFNKKQLQRVKHPEIDFFFSFYSLKDRFVVA